MCVPFNPVDVKQGTTEPWRKPVTLEPIPETWTRALAVVAHPDDLEYGAASAIARWTASGRSIGYVIVTDGEAGIDAIPPIEAAVLRQKEQLASAKIVGVDDVSFLHYRDGVVEYGLALRRDIARHIRRILKKVKCPVVGSG